MRNSNTSRDPLPGRRWLYKWAVFGFAAACLAHQTDAIDPRRVISQYMRQYWGSEKGFPGGSVSAIAQTGDGYLWIGTEKGLFRFDGLTFKSFQRASPTSVPVGAVQALVTDSQGNLWILLQNTNILKYRDGKFELGHDEAEFGITSMGKRRNGSALFASLVYGALTYNDAKFAILTSSSRDAQNSLARAPAETVDNHSSRLSWASSVASHRSAEPSSTVLSVSETSDGRIWLGTQDKGLYYLAEGRLVAAGKGLAKTRITCSLPLENGELWIGTERGVLRWDGIGLTSSGIPDALRNAEVLAMIQDRDSNIWVGTSRGLVRANRDGVAPDLERFENSGRVTALFEDREGNLWVGRTRGIERIRDGAFVTYSVAGLNTQSGGPVYVDQRGRAWFAAFEGGLHRLEGQHLGTVKSDRIDQDVVYSIAGRKNELWIGRRHGGLTHLREEGASLISRTYTKADGLPQNGVYAVHVRRDGSVWAATLGSGVSELKNGTFTNYTKGSGLTSNSVSSIAETPDETMWFATANGLNSLSRGQWHVITVRDGLPSDGVTCLFADSTGILWIGTGAGLAFLRSGQVEAPKEVPASLREEILGISEDKSGGLWIATANHVLAVSRNKLLGRKLDSSDVREYGQEDGLLGTEGVKRQRSVYADSLGHIWFSLNRGLSVTDTSRSASNMDPPAIVQIESLTTDGSLNDLQQPVRIAPGGHRVALSYSGLSLSVPERVKFRYRLDGFDRSWSEPVSTREAIYTNLGSGSYRFRVIACNSDGLWNSAESSIAFTIEPVFWRTWWFQLSSVVALGLLVLAYIRLRILALARQLNVRFEERLAERTRIAQELHDTLLQGLLSASMQLHVANDQLASESPAKPMVNRVLQLMGRVVDEGRNAVRGLRSFNLGSVTLEQAFSTIQQELGIEELADLRVIVEGTPRQLRPAIRDEVYLIGREGLVNALRHSGAKGIEVEIEYGPNRFRLLISDDGAGIDPQMLSEGRDGHWGLSGMRERAERIGAKLRLRSRVSSGTEVELCIPANAVYESEPSGRRFRFLSMFNVRSSGPQGSSKIGSQEPQ